MANGVIVSFVAPARGGDATAVRPRAGVEKGVGGGNFGWTKNFFAGFPVPHSPFPVPPKLGTDPAIANKIKGFWGGAGARGGRWPLPTLYRK